MRERGQLCGFYLPLALAALLAGWFVLEQRPAAPSRTRLMVLLVTSSEELPRRAPVWSGDNRHDAHGYAELLSAANIPFEMMWMERFEIPLRYLVEGELRKYAAVILATPARNLTDRSVRALLLASRRYGVSLIAAADPVDARLRLAFGLRAFRPDAPPEQRARPLPWARVRGAAGAPPVVVNRFGSAVNYYVAAGAGFLDGYGPVHGELREAIAANAGHGLVWAPLAGAAVLRLDDGLFNGSSFQQDPRWPHGLFARLDEAGWTRTVAALERYQARMSVGVVTGYADDGDVARGLLYRRGQLVRERRCGTVYDSREMLYVDRRGPRPGRRYDYESEYRGLLGGVRAGRLDAEVHGFAHIHDRPQWCGASDRETNLEWLMELASPQGRAASAEEQRRAVEEGMHRIHAWFDAPASTLIPPAHGMDAATALAARDAGLRLVDASGLSIIRPDRVIENGKIRTFWAHWPNDGLSDAALRAGYPFVVSLHDRELMRRGPEWFEGFLGRWRALGVARFITLRELAAHLGARLVAVAEPDALSLVVELAAVTLPGGGVRPLESPLTLRVRLPEGRAVRAILLDDGARVDHTVDGRELELRLPVPAGRDRRAVRIALGPAAA